MAEIGFYNPNSFTWITGDSFVTSGAADNAILFPVSYIAQSGDKVTSVRAIANTKSGNPPGSAYVVLIEATDPATVLQFIEFSNIPQLAGGVQTTFEATVDWPLTEGVEYALVSWTDGTTQFGEVDTLPEDSVRWFPPTNAPSIGDAVNADTYAGGRTPFIGALVDQASAPSIRKNSTFDIETALGTITTATLNSVNIADHITGQAGTTVSFGGAATDEITTSGEYTLTLGDGTGTEDITVQVNVVGLPANTARKDGGLLTSLTDLTMDAFNAGGTLVKSLTGITTDASGVISPVDLSDLSEAAGDTLKVSLHSAASGVGVTFEQALENI